jgi:hypothetical protein
MTVDSDNLTDVRINTVKAALQLTPDQKNCGQLHAKVSSTPGWAYACELSTSGYAYLKTVRSFPAFQTALVQGRATKPSKRMRGTKDNLGGFHVSITHKGAATKFQEGCA